MPFFRVSLVIHTTPCMFPLEAWLRIGAFVNAHENLLSCDVYVESLGSTHVFQVPHRLSAFGTLFFELLE